MSNTGPLSQGQEVFLRRPLQIYAKVIGPLESDSGLPEEQVRYAVQLIPLEQYYLLQDLEPTQRPQQEQPRLDAVIPESVEDPALLEEVTPDASAGGPFFDLAREINNLIALRAYELYEHRGFAHGHDAADWLQAESEILLNVPVGINETETQLAIKAHVPGFNENDLEVRIAPRSVCISGKRQEVPEQMGEKPAWMGPRPNRIFCVLDLLSEIDPATVDASVGGGMLEVKFLKVGLRKLVQVRAKTASA
jgi:HSP20 family molecular chaperone IbpA